MEGGIKIPPFLCLRMEERRRIRLFTSCRIEVTKSFICVPPWVYGARIQRSRLQVRKKRQIPCGNHMAIQGGVSEEALPLLMMKGSVPGYL